MTEPRDDAPAPLRREMGRRDFVKAAAGGVAAVAAGAAAVAMGSGLRRTLAEKVSYLGAKARFGPANWGLPVIPLRLDEAGRLEVVPENLAAHRVACHADAPGLDEFWAGDDLARFFIPEGRTAGLDPAEARLLYPYLDRVGEPILRTDLEALAPGDGIAFVWRSPEVPADSGFRDDVLRGILIRVEPGRMKGESVAREMLRDPPIVAFNSACTHMCCVAGWHEAPGARSLGRWDEVFCSCHLSTFDPYTIARYEFDPEKSIFERNREVERSRGVIRSTAGGAQTQEVQGDDR